MESIRRCDECRRVVHGGFGNACPFCGGTRLNWLEEKHATDPRMHPPVFRLALAFCLGLASMQIGAVLAGLHAPSGGHGAPLWHLNVLVGTGFMLYWALRKGEGDFRALFIAALGIFVLGEGMAALARAYGIGALRGLSGLFRHALLVFSSLGLTAGAMENHRPSGHERTMFAAFGGFLFLAVLHLMMEFLKVENDLAEDIANTVVAFSVAAFAGWTLYSEKSNAARDQEAKTSSAERLLTPEKDERA